MTPIDDCSLEMKYYDEEKLFSFCFSTGPGKTLEVKLEQDQFEELCSDMVRLIKDVNLKNIQDYTERMKLSGKEIESKRIHLELPDCKSC